MRADAVSVKKRNAKVGASAGQEKPDASLQRGAGGDTAGTSRLRLFLCGTVPDFILVAIASVALAFTVTYAFESAPELRSNPLVEAVVVLPMLVILFVGSWSKRAIVPSAFFAVAYAAVVVVAFASITSENVPLFIGAQVNDVAENYVVFGLVCLVVPVAVYLLSRRRIGVVILFALGVMACGIVQFLYRDWLTNEPGFLAAVVVVVSLGSLFVFQGYRSSVSSVHRLERTAFAQATLFAVGIVCVCVLAGIGLYFGIVAGLGLDTPEIKLFEDYYFRPTVEYSSTYEQQQIDDPDLLTSEVNDDQDDSNQDAEGGADSQSPEDNESSGANPISSLVRQVSSFDINEWTDLFSAVSYESLRLGILIFVIAAIALVVIAVLLQRSRRERRLRKFAALPLNRCIWELWRFLEKRFARLGISRPETLTPLEFAMASRARLAPFARRTQGVDYLALTLIYQRACYGTSATEEDRAAAIRFYRAFFGNARVYVGNLRWIIVFWRM